jgi:hypothetical protein
MNGMKQYGRSHLLAERFDLRNFPALDHVSHHPPGDGVFVSQYISEQGERDLSGRELSGRECLGEVSDSVSVEGQEMSKRQDAALEPSTHR